MADKQDIRKAKTLAEEIGVRSGLRSDSKKTRKCWKLAEVEKDMLAKLYAAGFGIPTLAKAVGIAPRSVYFLLKSRVKVRSKEQTHALKKALRALGRDLSVEEAKKRLQFSYEKKGEDR